MEIDSVCVLGAGAMGHGISLVCAQKGCNVVMTDIKEEFVLNGLNRIKAYLQGSLKRKKITTEEVAGILDRITTSTNISIAARQADLVIEAIVEDMKIKQDTYRQLDQICPKHTIFASNTSYQSITEMASVTKRADRFVGMHWFNPPQIMRGIEVITTEAVSPEVLDTIVNLCKKLGKESAICKDSAGFIANRVLNVWRNEAANLYDGGSASFQDIDIALKTAYNFRMGPFELGDLTGLEIGLAGNQTLYLEFKRDIFAPPHCVVMKVRAGNLGRKKPGRGFYYYESAGAT